MTTDLTSDNATIAVIGAGYVGLTTAVCFAHLGQRVVAADINPRRVEMLREAEPPILEEGLPDLLAEGVASGRLTFTTDPAEAAEGADFVFLCVPTPQGADGAADLSFVQEAAHQISQALKPGAVVVTKSTVPVGSVGVVIAALNRSDTAVVSNPEFLREGRAVHDWLNPDRVVIGSDDRRAAARLGRLYEPLKAPVIITDPASSETIKYACNAFLAAKVSFVNEIANLCDAVGADAVDVIRGMSYDRRIGADHLAPGPGWGGSCFPKDTSALIRIAEDHGFDFAMLKEAIASNNAQFDRVVAQVEQAAGGTLQGTTVAAWGLAFKAATDDLRGSPALAVLRRIADKGAAIRAFDPSLPDSDDPNLASLSLVITDDPYSACDGASVLVVLTEWPEFRQLDLRKVGAAMSHPAIVDTRNIIEPRAAWAAGCSYVGMGRL